MAGAACKVIINMFVRSLVGAVETILLNPNINSGKIPESDRMALIQRLADIDIATYTGSLMPDGGVRGIVRELEKHGLVTDEVWVLLNNVESLTNKSKKKEN